MLNKDKARLFLWLEAVVGTCILVIIAVGTRDRSIGTDTASYIRFFHSFLGGPREFSSEIGFTWLTWFVGRLGLGVIGYQVVLTAIIMLSATWAIKRFYSYLGRENFFLEFWALTLIFILISPFFINISTNVIRQGLSTFLVIVAILAFDQRRWGELILAGILAYSFHSTAIIYLGSAPMLLLHKRIQEGIGGIAFILYGLGISQILIATLAPTLYTMVLEYGEDLEYKGGIRLDFAVFSIAFFAIPNIYSYFFRKPRISRASLVYLAMLMPFYFLGWGSFSDRFLLTPWLMISMLVPAILYDYNPSLFRNRVLLGSGLIFSFFYFYQKVFL